MPKKDEHASLIKTLAEAGGSIVSSDNVKEFDYTNSYRNPVTRRTNHVFTHSNGLRVILEDDGTLYATQEPETATETATRERGTATESLDTIVKLRGHDTGSVQAVDGSPVAPPQPAPMQPLVVPDSEPTESAIAGLDSDTPNE